MGGSTYHLLSRSFAIKRSISKYNQMTVTMTPNAPHHSCCLGAPIRTPASIIPKFEMSIIAATVMMNKLIPMPIGPDECRNGTDHGVSNTKKMLMIYTRKIDPASVNTI